jgi:hypothetical protein
MRTSKGVSLLEDRCTVMLYGAVTQTKLKAGANEHYCTYLASRQYGIVGLDGMASG